MIFIVSFILLLLSSLFVARKFGYWNPAGTAQSLYISAIYIHPIKGCAPVPVQEANFTRIGLRHDRNWMLITGKPEKGSDSLARFLSLRVFPTMALLRPTIDTENEVMTVTTDGREPIQFPLYPTDRESYIENVKLFDDTIKVRIYKDEEINHWLTDYLGAPTRLATVVSLADHSRPLDPTYDPNPESKRIQPALSDNFPVLVASTASLADLNKRLTHRQVSMISFRPNIVLSSSNGTLHPWDEDLWTEIEIESSADNQNPILQLVKPCDRCTVPNVIPEFGIRDALNEPGKTLRTFRALNPEDPTRLYFGVNGVPGNPHGLIKVRDKVIARGKKKTLMDLPKKLST